MTVERMIELLEIEHECMLRKSHDDCDSNCADCDLVQNDDELHEMYTDVIWLMKKQEAKTIVLETNPYTNLFVIYCPTCGEIIHQSLNPDYPDVKYCRFCGQAVTW